MQPPRSLSKTATLDLSSLGDVGARLAFFRELQAVTHRIQNTTDIEELMLETAPTIAALFNAERMTLYVLDADGQHIVSLVKTGLNGIRELRLPISAESLAGYVAKHGELLNVADAYDEAGLQAAAPGVHFNREVDQRTGYHTRQVLAAPVMQLSDDSKLLGVIQFINNKDGQAFPVLAEEALQGLTQALATALTKAFANNQHPVQWVRGKYDALAKAGVLTSFDLEAATQQARQESVDVEYVLEHEYQITRTQIGEALSQYFGVPYLPYQADRLKPLELIRNLKREYLEEAGWLPVEENGDGILVLSTDPERLRSARTVDNVYPRSAVRYCVTTQVEFHRTLDQLFGSVVEDTHVDDLLSGMSQEELDSSDLLSEDLSVAASNELVRLVNKIIIDAHAQGASDIHLEPRPGKEKMLVRFRKDGTLVPYIEVPASYRNSIVARIKIMADLDISERRKPQDGKIKFRRFAPLDIELRVATLPTAGGMEDVVMRLLVAGEPIPLDKLGLSEHNLTRLKKVVSQPYGLFLVCGPTGSGKTTTLHSVLAHINSPETKIWTAEDPVEITQKGLRQVQVNRKAGLDFATVMRAFLRADPDVIMVGEMRDAETTSIGIEASLTGHLVLSTLHTNNAPESVTRLLDMGMDPFNFGDALLGILAQRLAKRLCPKCREAYTADEHEIAALLDEYCSEWSQSPTYQNDVGAAREQLLDDWKKRYVYEAGKAAHHHDHFTLYRAKGCSECSNTGYRGRIALHELMQGSEAIKQLIQEKQRAATIRAQALNEGMRTLRMDGVEKVLAGLTDIKQVRMVSGR